MLPHTLSLPSALSISPTSPLNPHPHLHTRNSRCSHDGPEHEEDVTRVRDQSWYVAATTADGHTRFRDCSSAPSADCSTTQGDEVKFEMK